MSEKKNIFVYAVCGDNIHIETLNFSLLYLKHFSKNNIIVVTDSKRNKINIEHDTIMDIDTPKEFTNHQASIYLKTGLHKYLDLAHNYCYIDSDVIAVNNKVDEIFDHNLGIVTFANDHCKFDEFSPYGINCGCTERSERSKSKFDELQKKYYPEFVPDSIFTSQEARQLYCDLYNVKQNPVSNIHIVFKYIFQKILLPYKYFRLNKFFKYDKKRKVWINNNNEIVMSDILSSYKEIENNSDLRFHRFKKYWKDKENSNIFKLQCDHLHQEILNKFNIKIYPKDWQHWNGGVFLFNKRSVEFLNSWHDLTMSMFKEPNWKTRDQATLAVTTWKFNLQHLQTLPVNFNFIADFYKPEISFSKEKGFTTNNFKTTFKPYFIHVYHHFGDDNWNIWQYIKGLSVYKPLENSNK